MFYFERRNIKLKEKLKIYWKLLTFFFFSDWEFFVQIWEKLGFFPLGKGPINSHWDTLKTSLLKMHTKHIYSHPFINLKGNLFKIICSLKWNQHEKLIHKNTKFITNWFWLIPGVMVNDKFYLKYKIWLWLTMADHKMIMLTLSGCIQMKSFIKN